MVRGKLVALLLAGGLVGCTGGGERPTDSSAAPPDALSPPLDVGPDVAPDVPIAWETGVHDPRVPPTEGYPYVFEDDDTELAEHLRFRAEGLTFDEMIPHAIDYLNKFVEKRRTAPSAAIRHFDDQRALVAAMRGAAPPAEATELLTVGLFGDLMWLGDGWDTFLDESLRAWMAETDLWLGNLETPIAESVPVPSFVFLPPEFNAPPGLVRSFRRDDGRSLFGALSFANNHTLDFEDGAARETLAFLDAEGIPALGVAEPDAPRFSLVEAKGIRVGLYGATWGSNQPEREATTSLALELLPGLAREEAGTLVDLSVVREALAAMTAAGAELRVVLLHWGHEYEMYPTALQTVVAREIVHAGADVVLGAHPHVAQPAELCWVDGYADGGSPPACRLETPAQQPRKALVLYSLGNFTTDMTTLLCQIGTLERLLVYRRPDGRVDWQLADGPDFVMNVADEGPDDTHLLLSLTDWLAADCFSREGCAPEDLDELAYLRAHLGL